MYFFCCYCCNEMCCFDVGVMKYDMYYVSATMRDKGFAGENQCDVTFLFWSYGSCQKHSIPKCPQCSCISL